MSGIQIGDDQKSSIEFVDIRNSPTGPVLQVIITEPERRLHVLHLTSETAKCLTEKLDGLDFEK